MVVRTLSTEIPCYDFTFRILDSNRDGCISLDEFRDGVRNLGIPVNESEVLRMFQEADLDQSRTISRAEFEKFCQARTVKLRGIYRFIDRKGNGRLTSKELRQGARAAGFQISDDQLRAFIDQADYNLDGVISFEEFCNALVLLPIINPRAVYESWQHTVPVDSAAELTVPRDLHLQSGDRSLLGALVAKLYAGGVAGAVSRTVTAPIDRLKMLLQAAPPGQATPGLWPTCVDIYREGGLRAFFRGNGANVAKVVPETAVKFVAFDFLKEVIAKDPGNATPFERFTAGGLAGTAAQVAIYPLEVVKTRMAVSPPGTYSSLPHCLRTLAVDEGVRALYRGLVPSAAGIIPYAGIDLAANSLLKEFVVRRCEQQGREPSVLQLLSCGMASSSTAMLATYPANLIRTRLQASGLPSAPRYDGFLDCLKRTLEMDGLAGLYRGLLPNAMKAVPATSVSYLVYDLLNR